MWCDWHFWYLFVVNQTEIMSIEANPLNGEYLCCECAKFHYYIYLFGSRKMNIFFFAFSAKGNFHFFPNSHSIYAVVWCMSRYRLRGSMLFVLCALKWKQMSKAERAFAHRVRISTSSDVIFLFYRVFVFVLFEIYFKASRHWLEIIILFFLRSSKFNFQIWLINKYTVLLCAAHCSI